MIKLENVSIVLPFFYDSEERGKNIYITLNYLLNNIDAEYIVPVQYKTDSDAVEIRKFLHENFHGRIAVVELIQNTPCHKTRLTNLGVSKSSGDIIILYDIDVLIEAHQLKNSIDWMREKSIDYMFPYTNPAYDVPYHVKDSLMNYANIDLEIIRKTVSPRYVEYSGAPNEPEIGYSPGWCVIFTKDSYINSGADNEEYIGACSEDSERIYRYVNLGFHCARFVGDVFHLQHPRNQMPNEHEQLIKNSKFYESCIKYMTPEQLKKYFDIKKTEYLQKYTES